MIQVELGYSPEQVIFSIASMGVSVHEITVPKPPTLGIILVAPLFGGYTIK